MKLTEEQMKQCDRFKNVRVSITPKMSQTDFGSAIGVSRDAVNNIENYRVAPQPSLIMLISQKYNVNPLYLSCESDVMHIPPDEDEELIDRALASQDPLIKALLLGIVKKPDGWRLLA